MTSPTASRVDHTAWSWVEHVRHGGSTPWAQWTPPAETTPAPASGRLPGAAQLEVVRRLAERPTAAQVDFPALADLVLARSGPGRGLGEIPLATQGAARSTLILGTPALDPSDVPVAELVRVCVGALCDLVLRAPRVVEPDPPRRRPWSKAFRLAGPPVSAAALRAALATSGHVEGGRKPRVVLVADSLDDMLREVWTARVQRGSHLRWPGFVGRCVREDRLPVLADLPLVASRWAARVGPGRVHIVARPHDSEAVRRTAAEILGVTVTGGGAIGAADVLPVPPQGVDLLVRISAVLNVRTERSCHRSLLRETARHLSGDGVPLVVPESYAGWARERSERMAEELRPAGYAVHGDLQQVVSRRTTQSHDSVHRGDVLDIALTACLRAAQR